MSGFDDYTVGSGIDEFPNQRARDETIRVMRSQGLNPAFHRPVPPMSFFAYEAHGQQSSLPTIRYFVEYKGL